MKWAYHPLTSFTVLSCPPEKQTCATIFFFNFLFNIYLFIFIWLCQVLLVAFWLLSCHM